MRTTSEALRASLGEEAVELVEAGVGADVVTGGTVGDGAARRDMSQAGGGPLAPERPGPDLLSEPSAPDRPWLDEPGPDRPGPDQPPRGPVV